MREQNRPQPHQMKYKERAFMPVSLKELKSGDIFAWGNGLYMLVFPQAEVIQNALQGHMWIVNLQSGGCWPIAGSIQVYPAHQVELTFATGRRED